MSDLLAPIRPYLWAAALALAAAAIWAAYSHGISVERGRWEKAQAKEKEARAVQQKANDDESFRRQTSLKEIAEDAVQERDAARASADAAELSGDRLRKQVANLTLSLAASGARTPASGEAAAASADLLDGVFGRLTEAENGIARYADEAATAGRACEASYDTLTQGAR